MIRKSTILTFMLFAFAKLQAQDYQISFAGSGESTTIETVLVQNLTQGTSLNLSGSDVLNLKKAITGIEQLTTNKDNSLQIYPNPMTSNSTIEFEISKTSNVIIELFDITENKVTTIQKNLQPGIQKFNVSGLNSGIYIVNARSDDFVYSGKIISNGTSTGKAAITFINSNTNEHQAKLKIAQSIVSMQYNTGDRILLKAVSGIYSTIKTLIPVANSTETFNFVAATDYDGNNYTTVTIGTQVWMVENLKVTHYRNGDVIANVTDNKEWTNSTNTGVFCWHNNDIANKASYGALYNWYAIYDERNIAPTGWHIPSDDEWTNLTDYLGGQAVAGGKMKEFGTKNWNTPNEAATNESGFTSLPSSSRSAFDGSFGNLGDSGGYWSRTPLNTNAYYRFLSKDNATAYRSNLSKIAGMGIRCVLD